MASKCCGQCDEHGAEVVRVRVFGMGVPREDPWEFDYCEHAIAIDERRGWTVEALPTDEGASER